MSIYCEQPGDGPFKYALMAPHTELASSWMVTSVPHLQRRELRLRKGKSLLRITQLETGFHEAVFLMSKLRGKDDVVQ